MDSQQLRTAEEEIRRLIRFELKRLRSEISEGVILFKLKLATSKDLVNKDAHGQSTIKNS